MDYTQRKRILSAINSDKGLNKDNVIEKIKEKLEIEDEEEYNKWKEADFNTYQPVKLFIANYCLLAVIHGYTKVKAALLEKEVDTYTREYGQSPLHTAVIKGDLETVKSMIKEGKNVNGRLGSMGYTPLHLAIYINGNKEIIKVLVDNSANVDAEDKNGRTPLHGTAFLSQLETVSFLIANDANVNAAGKDGETPLHDAAFLGQLEKVTFLIANGANVNAVGKDRKTPLHLAVCYSFHEQNVKVLIKKGADPFLKDKDGKTPFDLCDSNQKDYIIQLLKERAIEKGVAYSGATAALGVVIAVALFATQTIAITTVPIIIAVASVAITSIAVGGAVYLFSKPNTEMDKMKEEQIDGKKGAKNRSYLNEC